MVTSIIDAATRVLQSAGLDKLTTNRVAEIAGVSIGSLYQYFPGKDAILSQIIEGQIEKDTEDFIAVINANSHLDPRQIVELLVEKAVNIFWEKQIFAQILFDEVGRLKKTREILRKRHVTVKILTDFLKAHKEQLKEPELIDENVYVIAHAVTGVMQTAAIENFENHSLEVLRGHLKKLVIGYLFK